MRLFTSTALFLLLVRAGSAQEVSPAAVKFFEQKVRPVLVNNCQECHGAAKQRGKLRLDSLDAIKKGGELGPALVPGKPEDSRLVHAIGYKTDLKMPPKGKLSEADIANLTAGVQMGA